MQYDCSKTESNIPNGYSIVILSQNIFYFNLNILVLYSVTLDYLSQILYSLLSVFSNSGFKFSFFFCPSILPSPFHPLISLSVHPSFLLPSSILPSPFHPLISLSVHPYPSIFIFSVKSFFLIHLYLP